MTNEILVKGDAPDWWGDIESIKVGNTKNRYVKSIEIREINDVLDSEDDGEGRKTVGGRFVVHHMIWSTRVINADGSFGESTNWPVHEVGRNADVFDPRVRVSCRPTRSSCRTRYTCTPTGATPRPASRLVGGSSVCFVPPIRTNYRPLS